MVCLFKKLALNNQRKLLIQRLVPGHTARFCDLTGLSIQPSINLARRKDWTQRHGCKFPSFPVVTFCNSMFSIDFPLVLIYVLSVTFSFLGILLIFHL